MKALAKISESILDPDQIEQETEFNLKMDELVQWYFGWDDHYPPKIKCKYSLKNGALHIKSWRCAPRLDNKFLQVMKEYGVKKLVWDTCECTPKLYGDWWLDTEIINGHIEIRADEFTANLKSECVYVSSSCVFKNAKINTPNVIRFEHGYSQQFLGTTQFPKCPEIQMQGHRMNNGKWQDCIFMDKLIELGVVASGGYGVVSFVAPKNNPKIKITDIIGKSWPNVKEIQFHNLSRGCTMYICKDSAYDKNELRDCYSIEQYPIEGGWTIYFGRGR